MTLAIDTVDGHGLSNEVRHKLLSKKMGNAVLAICITVRGVLSAVLY